MGFLSLSYLLNGRRGERGLPTAAKCLPSALLVLIARRRRSRGLYDDRTLTLFQVAWRRSRSVSVMLKAALYRRDLGRPLPGRWIELLISGLSSLGSVNRRRAIALLAESAPQMMAEIPQIYIVEGSRSMAPQAFFENRCGGNLSPTWLVKLNERQQVWRDEFEVLLRESKVDGICLVGNAGSLIGSDLGNQIDSHGLVLRFNLCSGHYSEVSDIGKRMDVWVGSPGFSGKHPLNVDWVICTGPDMLYCRQNWTPFEERLIQGLPVLTVPLSIWRELVVECCAPPSSGILLLAWIREVTGSWQGVFTVGIGILPTETVPYHHVESKQLPYDRHNWEKERTLLDRWRSEGLRSQEFLYDSCEKK